MRAVAPCPDGEIVEVWFALLRSGQRWYSNGPFEALATAEAWAAASGRDYRIERRFEPGPAWYVRNRCLKPRLWAGHPQAGSGAVALGEQARQAAGASSV